MQNFHPAIHFTGVSSSSFRNISIAAYSALPAQALCQVAAPFVVLQECTSGIPGKWRPLREGLVNGAASPRRQVAPACSSLEPSSSITTVITTGEAPTAYLPLSPPLGGKVLLTVVLVSAILCPVQRLLCPSWLTLLQALLIAMIPLGLAHGANSAKCSIMQFLPTQRASAHYLAVFSSLQSGPTRVSS